tara:strand:+ start:2016 stop:2312 length:297 start_codon:yes stop_codon:yes gene_type:complete
MTLKYNEQGQPYEDPFEENKRLKKRIKELDNSLSIALNINDKYQRENKDLGEKCVKGGLALVELNAKYEASIREIDRLSEENTNIKTLTNEKTTSNSC